MDQWANDLLKFISAHPQLAAVVVGLTALGESFPFVNFVVPGGAILIGAGALVKAGVLDPAGILAAAMAGALVGDMAVYWLGWRFGTYLPQVWPFRKHPDALQRGTEFFQRYGQAAVFIGRFFGPLRAVVPTTAGVLRMNPVAFAVATVFSTLFWAPVLLGTGYLLHGAIAADWSWQEKVLVIAGATAFVAAAAYVARRVLHLR